ncbi:MAG: CDP-diacylglycerol--serine O-phosphatidyltransferase [Acidobacteriota bacterium]|nr:CDP-diacylglycerol--serine O-phosphatidyltransferase [Acidobacteriota bacterium]
MKYKRKRPIKIIFPSTITTFSMIFGYLAIIVATTSENYTRAGYLVMFSIIMDGLDGKVARITNTASDFGIQYDSLSDLVAFGVAPAVIYYMFFLHGQVTDQVYYLLPMMYLVCGAIRLARFNVTASIYGKNFFQGLPIPAAAFMSVSLPIFFVWARDYAPFQSWGWDTYLTKENIFQASIFVTIMLSLSMISTVRFDTPVNFWFRKYRFKPLNYLIVVAFFSLWPLIGFPVFCLSMCLYYLTVMYGRILVHKVRKHHEEPHPDDQDEPAVLPS